MDNIFLDLNKEPTEEYFKKMDEWLQPGPTNWKDLADKHNLTSEQVRQMHKSARRKLGTNSRVGFERESVPDSELPFDADEFVVTQARHTAWGSKGRMQFSNSVVVKPRDEGEFKLTRELVDEVLGYIPPSPPIQPLAPEYKPIIVEVPITDTHIGMEKHNITPFFNKIAVEVGNITMSETVEKISLVLTGDILHYADDGRKTVKGTQLQSSEKTPSEVVEEAARALIDLVHRLVFYAPVEVINVVGNHSKVLEYATLRMVENWFAGREFSNPTYFVITDDTLSYVSYYGTMVGLVHGDIAKTESGRWMPREFREAWGEHFDHVIHSGHEHQYSVDATGVATVHKFPPMCPRSEWEKGKGYTGQINACHIHKWGRAGLEGVNIVNLGQP